MGPGFESLRVYHQAEAENLSSERYSGCSAVRLAHLLWEQGVVGSNHATPTEVKKSKSDYIVRGVAQSG